MPTYEYSCPSCGHRYEKRESFSAPSRQKCPECSATAIRVLHAPPIVFKGSGFYATDNRSSRPSASSSSSSDDGAAEKPKEAASESAAVDDTSSAAAAG